MEPLFTSMVCERCDDEERGTGYGWIVWRGRSPGSTEYVFRNPEDARRWRAAQQLEDFPIRRVSIEGRLVWRQSTGLLKDLELADRLFEIYSSLEYPSGDNRAHLT